MPIFNTKKKAQEQAKGLSDDYNIQYSPEGDTFTIHGKDDITGDRGRTDLMVDADRWLPTLSRKKRLTTKYYQKLAEKQNLAQIKQTAADRNAALIKEQKELEKERALTPTVASGPTTPEVISNNTETIRNKKLVVKKKQIKQKQLPEGNIVPQGTWISTANTKQEKDKSKSLSWNVSEITPNNTLKWTVTKDNSMPKSDEPFLSQSRMSAFTRGDDGKYEISKNELFSMDPDNMSIKLRDIPVYKSTDDALQNFGLVDSWSKDLDDSPVFRVGDKFYNLNKENTPVEIDPVITKPPNVWGGDKYTEGRLMLNRGYDLNNIYAKLAEIRAYNKRVKLKEQTDSRYKIDNTKIRKLVPKSTNK